MMECPRCGFSQPADRFCASCGVDMEAFAAKPKPIWVRLMSNSNLHLTIIGLLIAGVLVYVFTHMGSKSRDSGSSRDALLSSRQAGVPGEDSESRDRGRSTTQPNPAPPPAATAAAATERTASQAAESKAETFANSKLEVTHWEVAREALLGLVAQGDKLGESNAGRAYFFDDADKTLETIKSAGQILGEARSAAVKADSQIAVETPASATEAFQIGIVFQMAKPSNRGVPLQWNMNLVLPQVESAAQAANPVPSVRAVVEAAFSGRATLTGKTLLLIVMDPTNRSPRDELLVRAGDGPWSIFGSPEFRTGISDWAITVRLQ